MPSGFLALWQSLVSSANLDILLTILVSRSFMHITNSSRPNTLPCGTPDVTGAQLLYTERIARINFQELGAF